jgi:hypothetical protein
MMKKLAKVGYRVAPMYNDEPNGTITEVVNDLFVMVKWDGEDPDRKFGITLDTDWITKEQIKYLRKGV